MTGEQLDTAMNETQARLVERFRDPCEEIWHHGRRSGRSADECRGKIADMIVGAVDPYLTDNALLNGSIILSARRAATEICDRFVELET